MFDIDDAAWSADFLDQYLNSEQWIGNSELWTTLHSEQWTLNNELWTINNELWMNSKQWTLNNKQWTLNSKQWTLNSCCNSEQYEQWTLNSSCNPPAPSADGPGWQCWSWNGEDECHGAKSWARKNDGTFNSYSSLLLMFYPHSSGLGNCVELSLNWSLFICSALFVFLIPEYYTVYSLQFTVYSWFLLVKISNYMPHRIPQLVYCNHNSVAWF